MSSDPVFDELLERVAQRAAEIVCERLGESGTAKLMTTNEAASFMRVHPKTVRRLVLSGELPHRRVGRKILVNRADVLRSLASTSDAMGAEIERLLRKVG